MQLAAVVAKNGWASLSAQAALKPRFNASAPDEVAPMSGRQPIIDVSEDLRPAEIQKMDRRRQPTTNISKVYDWAGLAILPERACAGYWTRSGNCSYYFAGYGARE